MFRAVLQSPTRGEPIVPSSVCEMLPAPVSVCVKPYIWGGAEDKTSKWGLYIAETFLPKNVRKTDIFFLLILWFV